MDHVFNSFCKLFLYFACKQVWMNGRHTLGHVILENFIAFNYISAFITFFFFLWCKDKANVIALYAFNKFDYCGVSIQRNPVQMGFINVQYNVLSIKLILSLCRPFNFSKDFAKLYLHNYVTPKKFHWGHVIPEPCL